MHASIRQKWEGGLFAGLLRFCVTTITDPRMLRDICTFSEQTQKNDKVRHNNIMTQIGSLLAVATVFIGLWTLNIYVLLLGRGAYTRDNAGT